MGSEMCIRDRSGFERSIEDIDLDGDFDILFKQCTTRNGSNCNHINYINDGAGQFVRETGPTGFPAPSFTRALDLDEDGQNELVKISKNSLIVYKLGDEGWLPVGTSDGFPSDALTFVSRIDITDANGDAINDLVIRHSSLDFGHVSIIGLALGKSEFEFAAPLPFVEVAAGTSSGDGLTDSVSYLFTLTESQRGFDWEATFLGRGDHFSPRYFADLDADGDQDFVLLNDQGVTIVYRQNPGDFDDDQDFDSDDLDFLYQNLQTHTAVARAIYDLNHDYAIDQLDIDFWVTHSAKTLRGDANLDGTVDFVDFLALAGSFGKVGTELRGRR